MDRETLDWRRRALKAEAEVAELREVLRLQWNGRKPNLAAAMEARAAQHAAEEWALVALMTLKQLHYAERKPESIYQLSLEVPA